MFSVVHCNTFSSQFIKQIKIESDMDTMHCQKIKMSRQHSYQVFIDITLRYKFYIIFDRTFVPEFVQCKPYAITALNQLLWKTRSGSFKSIVPSFYI